MKMYAYKIYIAILSILNFTKWSEKNPDTETYYACKIHSYFCTFIKLLHKKKKN